jgi:PAS domain S-box-containing protein
MTLQRESRARVDAQVALAASEEQFRMLINGVRDYAIFLLDPGGRVISWNPGAERIKGYTAAEVLGSHFSRFYIPEDLAAGKTEHELKVASEVGKYEEEGWRVRKDGSWFWANVVITALRDEAGVLRGFAKITRDLTERRKAEDELRASEERFRMLVSGVQDYAIFLLDPEGNVVTWNAGAQRIKGYTADEIVGQHFSRFYTPEDLAAGKTRHELMIATRDGVYEEEGWRVRKDGSKLWASVVITALRDEQGRLRGFSKVTRDITTRRESERIKSIVDNVVDGIVTFDENLTIESLNLAAERIFGYQAAELVGTSVTRLAPEGDPLEWIVPAGAPTEIREVFGRRKDGAAFPMDLAIGPFHFQGRRAYTAVVRDITERRRADEQLRFYTQQLRDKNAELARSNQELDDFAYIASHDLKEPLRGIHNYANFLLEDYAARLDDDGRSKLETLTLLAKRMEALIDSLLQFSRVGRVELSNTDTDLNDVLRATLEPLQITLAEEGVEVRVPRPLPTLRCDRVRVREVFHNLIINGIKYNDKPHKWVEVGWQERDGLPRLYVRDNGIGMPTKHHESIFRIFKRLHGRDKYGGGTGVGLTIVKKIVERHGGSISVESKVGQGSTFRFSMPQSEGQ